MSLSSNNSVSSPLDERMSAHIPSHISDGQVEINNQVTIQDVERFANLKTTVPGSLVNHLVHRGANPTQQISHQDQQVHDISRVGWGSGTYPTNYEVGLLPCG